MSIPLRCVLEFWKKGEGLDILKEKKEKKEKKERIFSYLAWMFIINKKNKNPKKSPVWTSSKNLLERKF